MRTLCALVCAVPLLSTSVGWSDHPQAAPAGVASAPAATVPANKGVISLRVVDLDGDPIEGIPVVLNRESKTGSVRETRTDSRGLATFGGLVEGKEYVFLVLPPVGGRVEVYEKAGPSSSSPRDVRLLDVRAGVPLTPRAPTPEEEGICEIVLRDLLARQQDDLGNPRDWIFLTLLGKDPGDGFLNRFSHAKARVRPGSFWKRDQPRRARFYDVHWILWVNPDKVELGAGYSWGNMASGGYTYRMIRDAKGWRIESCSMNWIS